MPLFLTKVTITVSISAKFSFVQSLCVHRHILHFNRLFDHPADKVVGYQRFWFANMSKLFWLTIHRSCETQIWEKVSCDGTYNFLRNIRKSQSPLLLLYEKEKCFWRFTRGPKNNECFATNEYMCSLYRKYSIKVINKYFSSNNSHEFWWTLSWYIPRSWMHTLDIRSHIALSPEGSCDRLLLCSSSYST